MTCKTATQIPTYLPRNNHTSIHHTDIFTKNRFRFFYCNIEDGIGKIMFLPSYQLSMISVAIFRLSNSKLLGTSTFCRYLGVPYSNGDDRVVYNSESEPYKVVASYNLHSKNSVIIIIVYCELVMIFQHYLFKMKTLIQTM